MEQVLGDLTPDLDVGVQRARQRRVGDDHDAGVLGGFTDLEREVVDALGDDDGCGTPAVVFQRDGVVGRVGDDHVCGGNGVHHARAGELHRPASLCRFDFGRKALLLELLLDLLLVHPQALLVPVALPEVVGGRDRRDRRSPRAARSSSRCRAICGIRSAGGVPTSAASSSSFGNSASAAIAPTIATLSEFLTVSTARCCGLKRFLRPEAGLIFLKSGLIASGVGLRPTWPAEAASPATKQTAAIGSEREADVLADHHEQLADALAVDDLRARHQRDHLVHRELHLLHHLRADRPTSRAGRRAGPRRR